MVQSININHPESTLENSNENTKYLYNGLVWARHDNIKIDRYIDIPIDYVELLPNGGPNDYIEISKSCYNYCLQSEKLELRDYWKPTNAVVSTSSEYFSFPSTTTPAYVVRTEDRSYVSHSLMQRFKSDMTKLYTFSFFAKDFVTTQYSKAAIAIKDCKYNVVMAATFDLKDETIHWDNNRAHLEVKFYDANTFQEILTGNPFIQCSATITRIFTDENHYYRPCITFKLRNTTLFEAGIYLLNEQGQFKYEYLGSPIRFYTSGYQLEAEDNEDLKLTSLVEVEDDVTYRYPSPYMLTSAIPVKHIIACELYTYTTEHERILMPDNHIHYLNVVRETQNETIKTLVSSDPTLQNYNVNDIAVIQSVISVGTEASMHPNVSYPEWVPQTYYKVGDKIKYIGTVYQSLSKHISSAEFNMDVSKWEVILDAVGLGTERPENVPNNCIYYDKIDKEYKIKKPTSEGDQWLTLNYQSYKNKKHALVESLVYGQGRYETWDRQSSVKPVYILGFNTGGNYNYGKLASIGIGF